MTKVVNVSVETYKIAKAIKEENGVSFIHQFHEAMLLYAKNFSNIQTNDKTSKEKK